MFLQLFVPVMPCGNLDMHFGDYCVPELLCDSFHTCSHACHFGPHLFASGCIPAPPHGGTTTPLCIPAVIEHCKSYHRQSWSYPCHVTCLPCGHTCSHPCHLIKLPHGSIGSCYLESGVSQHHLQTALAHLSTCLPVSCHSHLSG